MAKDKIYIGIDPGANAGICIWDGKKIVHLETSDFWGAIHEISWRDRASLPDQSDPVADYGTYPVKVVIEDPSQNKPTFKKHWKELYTAMKSGSWLGVQTAVRKMLKIAQNIGMNKREATLLIEYCKRNGIECRAVRPTTAKWTKDYFRKITGYKGRVSQHAIDACKLVYGL